MGILIIVGIVSGIITAISPCVLPVLPAILANAAATVRVPSAVGLVDVGKRPAAASADKASPAKKPVAKAGSAKSRAVATLATTAPTPAPRDPSRWRPAIIVASLAASFALFTLVGGTLLSYLHLPDTLLRWIGVAVIALLGLALLIPAVGHLAEKPFTFSRLPTLNADGNAVLLGAGLGLVFVPCAGPVLTVITVLAAGSKLSWGLVILSLSFAIGVSIPLLGFAYGGRAIAERVRATTRRLQLIRAVAGGILLITAAGTALNWFESAQRWVPSFLTEVQSSIEENDSVKAQLDSLTGRESQAVGDAYSFDDCDKRGGGYLWNCGPARDLPGITKWLNTDGEQPLTLESLKGKVVLIDFWTYSCINCQRTFPYLTTWYDRYKDDGLVIIGVHTPEFTFEKSEDNVRAAIDRFGINYPVAMDNDFATWTEWDQSFWPAHYLIDRDGIVREVHYGEGAYPETELRIQDLLGAKRQDPILYPAEGTTIGRTPESYIGAARLKNLWNEHGKAYEDYPFDLVADPPPNYFSFGGTWRVEDEFAKTVKDSQLALHFFASDVHLVIAGEGTVTVTRDGEPGVSHTVNVSGEPQLYTLYDDGAVDDTLRLTLSPGLQLYAFTFG